MKQRNCLAEGWVGSGFSYFYLTESKIRLFLMIWWSRSFCKWRGRQDQMEYERDTWHLLFILPLS